MSKQTFNYCPNCQTGLQYTTIDDRKRQRCPNCGWVHYMNPLPCAAALVINAQDEVLLVKRGVEPARGEWALPSGFIEIDEIPEEACLRELQEETGLSGRLERLIGVYSQDSLLYKRVIIIGYQVVACGTLQPGSDTQDAAFFVLDDMPEIAFSSHRAIIRDGQKPS